MVVTDKIKEELSRNQDIVWYQVRCFNDGMLNSYSRIGVELASTPIHGHPIGRPYAAKILDQQTKLN